MHSAAVEHPVIGDRSEISFWPVRFSTNSKGAHVVVFHVGVCVYVVDVVGVGVLCVIAAVCCCGGR